MSKVKFLDVQLQRKHKLSAGNWPMFDLARRERKPASKPKLVFQFHYSVLVKSFIFQMEAVSLALNFNIFFNVSL